MLYCQKQLFIKKAAEDYFNKSKIKHLSGIYIQIMSEH